ncbi:MAG TPA: hypothetical protein VGB89_07945 [Bacteroidota bacterium]
MSLKSFHIFFITVSVLLAMGMSAWSAMKFADTGDVAVAFLCLFSIAGGVLLIIYGIRMRRKLHELGYKWDVRNI